MDFLLLRAFVPGDNARVLRILLACLARLFASWGFLFGCLRLPLPLATVSAVAAADAAFFFGLPGPRAVLPFAFGVGLAFGLGFALAFALASALAFAAGGFFLHGLDSSPSSSSFACACPC